MANALSGNQNALETALGNAIQAQIVRVNNFYQQNQQVPNPLSDYTWLSNRHANLGNRTGFEAYPGLVANNTPQQLQALWGGLARPNIQSVVLRMAWLNVLEEAMRNLAARLRATQNFQPQINQPRQWDTQAVLAVLNGVGQILPDLVVYEAPLALSTRQNATTSANVKFLDNNVALLFFTHFLETN
ncbi:hypothetical protein FGLOB1_14601 [Fusarium globosum]|uniref:Uncharacterized protein n=1 Tax=Fusarium globosum TaxID=78864 RepID=A0A8H5XCV5_9HYPO|nr:hypothetical protein FGLOB1_14601 [Fusarium globosum]